MFLGGRFFLSFFHLSLFVSSGAKQCEGLYFRGPFWHDLGDFLAPPGWFRLPFWDQLGAKGPQNRPFWHQVAPKNQRKKLSRKSATVFCARAAFWHHLGDFGRPLGDFGRHLGASWPPRGSQNPPFWHQVASNFQKMSPKMRHRKMYENLIELWWKKWRFWMSSTHRTIMYKSILVVGAYYDNNENLMKKWCKKAPKIDAKSDIWAIRGPTLEGLGHVFGQAVF